MQRQPLSPHHRRRAKPVVVTLLIATAAVAACGSGDDDGSVASETQQPGDGTVETGQPSAQCSGDACAAEGDGSPNSGDPASTAATTGDGTSTATANGERCAGALCDLAAQLKAAHNAASIVAQEALQSANIGATAVNQASLQGGGGYALVTTGTLAEQAGGAFSYSPDPTDRLVIRFAKGDELSYVINQAQGVLDGDHHYDYRVTSPGVADMHFTSLRGNGQLSDTAKGTLTIEGLSYEIDLTRQGTYYFENDSTGSEQRDDYRTSGTVRATAFTLQVDETWHFELVSSSGISGRTATSDRRTINNTLQVGNRQLRWNNVVIQKQFLDGLPTDENYWKAQGTITADGAPIAEYKHDVQLIAGNQYGGFMLFQLALVDGPTVELERWNGAVHTP